MNYIFLLFIYLLPFLSQASNISIVESIDAFEQFQPLIEKHINGTKNAELHFFWTTGRTIRDNAADNAVLKVDVGGSEYEDKFFPYVQRLLAVSPSHLKVKLVCDDLTLKSNQGTIQSIQQNYPERFEILLIQDVEKRLTIHFADYAPKIQKIFINAVAGHPVLTSDIYRLIGMMYGQERTNKPTEVQYTYCDIDLFCGMNNDAERLINALFQPEFPVDRFYLGRSRINNDLIKLIIANETSYENFCKKVLIKVDTENLIFGYFHQLHEKIKRCENDASFCSEINNLIENHLTNPVRAVTETTGPEFLDILMVNKLYKIEYPYSELNYRSNLAGSWYSPAQRLDYKLSYYEKSKPSSIVFWGLKKATKKELEATKGFNKVCNHYRKVLHSAFYGKRFGKNHPFNKFILEYLKNNHPYTSKELQDMLKVNLIIQSKPEKKSYSYLNKKANTIEDFKTLEPSKGTVFYYLVEGRDELHYIIKTFDETRLAGQISFNEYEKKSKIKKAISAIMEENKLPSYILKTLSYEQWSQQVLTSINAQNFHYQELKGLLDQLEIKSPEITKDYIHAWVPDSNLPTL